MIIAFCSTGTSMDAPLSGRFGRADYFLFFDTETKDVTATENSAKNAAGGAGGQAVQQLVDAGVAAVIAPETGPQAFTALEQFSITPYRQENCTNALDALEAWNRNELQVIENPMAKGLHRA